MLFGVRTNEMKRRSTENETDSTGPLGINVIGVDSFAGANSTSVSVWKKRLHNQPKHSRLPHLLLLVDVNDDLVGFVIADLRFT